MLVYVAHAGGTEENLARAKRITRELAIFDTSNTYICPLLALSHLGEGDIGLYEESEQRIDLLSACDKLIIASEVTDEMRGEMEFAEKVHMEVALYEAR